MQDEYRLLHDIEQQAPRAELANETGEPLHTRLIKHGSDKLRVQSRLHGTMLHELRPLSHSLSARTGSATSASWLFLLILNFSIGLTAIVKGWYDKHYESEGAAPSAGQQEKNLSSAKRDLALFFVLYIVGSAVSVYGIYKAIDVRKYICHGYQDFHRSVEHTLRDDQDKSIVIGHLVKHINHLFTQWHGTIAIAHMIASLSRGLRVDYSAQETTATDSDSVASAETLSNLSEENAPSQTAPAGFETQHRPVHERIDINRHSYVGIPDAPHEIERTLRDQLRRRFPEIQPQPPLRQPSEVASSTPATIQDHVISNKFLILMLVFHTRARMSAPGINTSIRSLIVNRSRTNFISELLHSVPGINDTQNTAALANMLYIFFNYGRAANREEDYNTFLSLPDTHKAETLSYLYKGPEYCEPLADNLNKLEKISRRSRRNMYELWWKKDDTETLGKAILAQGTLYTSQTKVLNDKESAELMNRLAYGTL